MSPPTPITEYALTPMQEGMLYQWRLSKVSGINLEQLEVKMPEVLKVEAFEYAWQQTILRFEALRTSFSWDNKDQPTQKVWSDAPLEFTFHDWREHSPKKVSTAFEQFLDEDRERGFDLSKAPLMRVNLFQLRPQKFRMLWTFHHIVLDGRSFPIVLRDLFKIYEAKCANQTLELPKTPSFKPYVDYVNHQDEAEAKAYWQHLLADVAEQQLPSPHANPAQSQHVDSDQNELEAKLSANAISKLQTFAEQHHLTLHTLLQAAWSLTLSAFTGSDDVVFGTVRACRHLPVEGLNDLAGMLINTLPFRAKLNPETKLIDWLAELRQQQVDVRPFEATPLQKIQAWAGIPPGTQLIRTMLMFDYRFLGAVLKRDGGKWKKRELTLYEKTEFHLGLSAYLDESLVLRLEYDSSVYSLDTCEDILAFVAYLLEHFPKFANHSLRQIPTMPNSVQHDLLKLMSPTRSFVRNCGLHQLFETQAAKAPHAVAVRSGEAQLSYKQLDAAANQWAHYFIAQGVKPGDVVGVSLSRTIELPKVLLGILKAGAGYLPLDPNYPIQRLEWMLEDTEPKCVLTEDARLEKLPLGNIASQTLEQTPLAQYPQHAPNVQIDPESAAIVIFTSGSTGRPKGVMLPHRALINHNQAVQRMFAIGAQDRVAQMSTINFDVSIEELFTTLNAGATLVIPPQSARESISGFLRFLQEMSISVLNLTTLFWQEVVHQLVREQAMFPESVRLIIAGGERTTHSAYNEFLKVGGERIQWINAYGPTETCPMATAFEPKGRNQLNPLKQDPPIGRPIDNTRCYVLDQMGRLLPPGVPGELYIGGESVSSGYLKQPDLTRDRFLPDPFDKKPGALMYKTGDRVCLSHVDGQLNYLDRLDNQIKLRGFRIELGEIETVLNRCPQIDEGVVQPVARAGGQQQLVAYVISQQGTQLDTDPVMQYLQDHLPAFMRPTLVVALERFPKTPAGKIDRRALPVPEQQTLSDHAPQEKPKNETQAQVLKHWQDVLGVEHISLQDNFFALGGNSLKAMSLATRIEESFGRAIPLALLINAPTLEMYAQAIQQDIEAEGFAPRICMKEGEGTPLFLLHSLGGDILIYIKLAELLNVQNPIYGIQMQGLDRQKAPHRDLGTCATDFIKLVKEVQPQGPYALAGYSSGGLIAFEMARQLRDSGDQVDFLAMIDSAIPPKIGNAKLSTGRYMANFLRNLPAWAADVSRWKPKRILRAINRKVIQVALNRRRPATPVPQKDNDGFRLEEHFEMDLSFFPAYRIELIRRHFAAIAAYEPGRYQGNACILRTRRQPLFSAQNKSLGWDQLVEGKLDIQFIPGHHGQMLEEPNVEVLAKKLLKGWKAFSDQVRSAE